MQTTYKTSLWALFRHSFLWMFATMMIGYGIMLHAFETNLFEVAKQDALDPSLLLLYGISFIVACLLFITQNKRVCVTEEGITFFRGEKICATFPRKDYSFSSHIFELISFGVPPLVSRYLVTTHKESQKEKKYRLFLSGKKFDEFISVAETLNDN